MRSLATGCRCKTQTSPTSSELYRICRRCLFSGRLVFCCIDQWKRIYESGNLEDGTARKTKSSKSRGAWGGHMKGEGKSGCWARSSGPKTTSDDLESSDLRSTTLPLMPLTCQARAVFHWSRRQCTLFSKIFLFRLSFGNWEAQFYLSNRHARRTAELQYVSNSVFFFSFCHP